MKHIWNRFKTRHLFEDSQYSVATNMRNKRKYAGQEEFVSERKIALKENPSRLFFLHIPKTGGTTIDTMLREHFAPVIVCPSKFYCAIYMPPAIVDKYWYFSAHAPYDLIFNIPKPCQMISVFRNPITRSISEYYFNRSLFSPDVDLNNFSHQLLAQSFSFMDYLNLDSKFIQHDIVNPLCAQICGHKYLNPDGTPWRSDSEKLDVGYERIGAWIASAFPNICMLQFLHLEER